MKPEPNLGHSWCLCGNCFANTFLDYSTQAPRGLVADQDTWVQLVFVFLRGRCPAQWPLRAI